MHRMRNLIIPWGEATDETHFVPEHELSFHSASRYLLLRFGFHRNLSKCSSPTSPRENKNAFRPLSVDPSSSSPTPLPRHYNVLPLCPFPSQPLFPPPCAPVRLFLEPLFLRVCNFNRRCFVLFFVTVPVNLFFPGAYLLPQSRRFFFRDSFCRPLFLSGGLCMDPTQCLCTARW